MNSHDVMLSWTAEGDKRLQEARASGSKLQLTHMALGNASTPLSITDLKQAREVRSVIYQAPLDGVTVDREKNSVIGELILPEDKKEEAIREIGIFELDTLVAVGYSSSPYRDVRQQSGERIQLVRLPLNTIPASAIETLSNVINFKESDTRYLHAAENLKDLTNKKTARSNFELGTAAVKNAGTNHSDLITTGEADNRYLKHSENLLATKADKADVSKHSQFFHLFVDDPDVLAYLLQPGLTSDQLEAWLASDNNEEKFTRLFTHSVAIQIIISNSAAFTMLVNSPRAIKAAVKSQAMLVAMVSAEPALAVVVNSQTVMNAVANSRAALDVIGMSTLACQAIEEGQYQVPMIADLGKKIDRKDMAIAVVGNKAIFFGGYTTSPSATIDIYHAASGTWRAVSIIRLNSDCLCTIIEKNKAVFIGRDVTNNDVKKYTYLDTDNNGLITRGAADKRYLNKNSENLLFTQEDKADVSKHTQFFQLFFGDPDGLAYLLRPGLKSDQLEAWLANDNNGEKFTAVVASQTAVTAVAASQTAMNAVAASQIAMNAVATSSTTREILRNSSTAMAEVGKNSMAIAKLTTGLAGLNPLDYADMAAVAASKTAMNAVAASQTAMNAVATSSTTREILRNSSTAMAEVGKNSMAIAKLTTGLAGLNPLDYADMAAVAASKTAMNAVAASQTAMNAVATSSTTREILRNSSTAMAEVGKNSMAIAKLTTGLAGLNPLDYADMAAVAASKTAMNAVAASQTAMNAVAGSASAIALNAIVKSELASKAIEVNLQSPRITVQSTLNAASGIFKKTNETIGSGGGSWESGANSATIYIPTSSNDNANGMYDNDYYVYSLLPGNRQLAFIPKHSGAVNVTSGLALRGVRVQGLNVGSSTSETGNVTFDVYTAV